MSYQTIPSRREAPASNPLYMLAAVAAAAVGVFCVASALPSHARSTNLYTATATRPVVATPVVRGAYAPRHSTVMGAQTANMMQAMDENSVVMQQLPASTQSPVTGAFVAASAMFMAAVAAVGYAVGRATAPAPEPVAMMGVMGKMTGMKGKGDDDEDMDELMGLIGLAENADLAGAIGPVGYFDPLGISTGKDFTQLKVWREMELRHGRVAMLAAAGFPLAEVFHPFFGGNIDAPSISSWAAPELKIFWLAMIPIFLVIETPAILAFKPAKRPGDLWTYPEKHIAGDYGYDPLGMKPTKTDELEDMQNKELSNGRLAMIGIMGMIAQELVSGQGLFTDVAF